MIETRNVDETPPKCITCQKEIEECTWIYYGGDIKIKPPGAVQKYTTQVYWCEKCFETKVMPKLNKGT